MIIIPNELRQVRDRHAAERLVLTSGTFDLFHVGHLNYLEAAKNHGEVLVVLLSGDGRVQGRKGASRPIITEDERAKILDALKVVDYVLIDPVNFADEQASDLYAQIIAALQPDVYVTDGEDPRFTKLLPSERRIVLPRVDGGRYGSTSAIIEYIQNS